LFVSKRSIVCLSFKTFHFLNKSTRWRISSFDLSVLDIDTWSFNSLESRLDFSKKKDLKIIYRNCHILVWLSKKILWNKLLKSIEILKETFVQREKLKAWHFWSIDRKKFLFKFYKKKERLYLMWRLDISNDCCIPICFILKNE